MSNVREVRTLTGSKNSEINTVKQLSSSDSTDFPKSNDDSPPVYKDNRKLSHEVHLKFEKNNHIHKLSLKMENFDESMERKLNDYYN